MRISLQDDRIVRASALVVPEVQSAEVLQCSDGKGVLDPLRQTAVLTVEPQY
ncbi:hypothetical protein [Streptomyces sp. NPDC017958]|uniref:hypothetical protein n=1 Tax=Streptomyces sp. NPDC017958 TaxID=3365021 RepID=UPI003790570C